MYVLRKSAQSAGAIQSPLCILIKQCIFCENLRNLRELYNPLIYPDKTMYVLRKSAQSAGAMQIPLMYPDKTMHVLRKSA